MTKKLVKRLGQLVIAPHFQLVSTLLGDIAAEDAALVRLGEEQAICLDFLDLNPRVHVEGGAGTGKTMIACEIARRMASNGASVLLLCFNTPLGHRLQSFAEAHGSEAVEYGPEASTNSAGSGQSAPASRGKNRRRVLERRRRRSSGTTSRVTCFSMRPGRLQTASTPS